MKPRWYDAALVGLLAVLLLGASVTPRSRLYGTISVLGNVIFVPDNTFDIGATDANRPRDIFAGRNIELGTDAANGSNIILATSGTSPSIAVDYGNFVLGTVNAFAINNDAGSQGTIGRDGDGFFIDSPGTGVPMSLRTQSVERFYLIYDLLRPTQTHSAVFGDLTQKLWAIHVQSLMVGTVLAGTPPADGMPRLHVNGMMHIAVSYSVLPHIVVVANNTVGAQANIEILSGLRSRYSVDCNDPDGCTIQFGTTAINSGLQEGAETRVMNISTNVNTLLMQDLASVQHTAAAMTMGTNDNMTLQVVKNRNSNLIWVEVGRSDN